MKKKTVIPVCCLLLCALLCSCTLSGTGSGGKDIALDDSYSDEYYADETKPKSRISFIVPLHGEITSPFGNRINPITKVNSFHTGVDVGVKENTQVACAAGGVVEEVGKSNAYGNYVLVSHDENYQTYYAHCNEILVEAGTVIRQGEIIALSGNTGSYTTGPHLHFGIIYNGNPIDPLSCLDGVSNEF